MLKLSGRKKWMSSEELLRDYPNYLYFAAGIQKLKPSDIVGLSLPLKIITQGRKMEWLMSEVQKHGWNDPFPGDLHLYLLPTGKYVVGTGGNHRPVLANELNIPTMQAYVDVLLPIELLQPSVYSDINRLEEQAQNIEQEAFELNKFLRLQGIRRETDFPEENKQLQQLYEELDQFNLRRHSLLREEAERLGFIPSTFDFTK